MADLKSPFLNVYSILKSDLFYDPSFESTDESHLWLKSFKLLKECEDLNEEEVFLSCALGWCIEWACKSFKLTSLFLMTLWITLSHNAANLAGSDFLVVST